MEFTLETKEDKTITHTIKWYELMEEIHCYIWKHYKLEIPNEAQIRVLDRKGVMVNPFELRIKFNKKGDDQHAK